MSHFLDIERGEVFEYRPRREFKPLRVQVTNVHGPWPFYAQLKLLNARPGRGRDWRTVSLARFLEFSRPVLETAATGDVNDG